MASDWRLQRIDTHDVDDLSLSVEGWTQRYTKLEPGSFHGSLTIAAGSGLQVFSERTQGVILEEGEVSGETLGLGIPVHASGDAFSFGSRLAADQQVMGFFAPRRLHLRTPEDFGLLVVSVRSELFRELVEPDRRLAIVQLPTVRGQLPAWMRDELVAGSHRLMDARTDVARLARARSQLVDHLLEALLGFEHTPVRGKGHLCRQTVEAALSQVRTWMGDRADVPLGVAALCEALGVPRRTLQYSFEQALGVTPLHYLKSVRLAGARRSLKSGQGSVLDCCLQWGFDHPSAFARDYQAMFGERPSQTLERARGARRIVLPAVEGALVEGST